MTDKEITMEELEEELKNDCDDCKHYEMNFEDPTCVHWNDVDEICEYEGDPFEEELNKRILPSCQFQRNFNIITTRKSRPDLIDYMKERDRFGPPYIIAAPPEVMENLRKSKWASLFKNFEDDEIIPLSEAGDGPREIGRVMREVMKDVYIPNDGIITINPSLYESIFEMGRSCGKTKTYLELIKNSIPSPSLIRRAYEKLRIFAKRMRAATSRKHKSRISL